MTWTRFGCALCAALALHVPAASAQYYQVTPPDRRAMHLMLSKPFVGDNYGALTSTVEAALVEPLRPGLALTIRTGFTHATAGKTSTSTTIAHPVVGVSWKRSGLPPGEVALGVPVGTETGDDDYATDVAVLSDLDRRERYRQGRWSVAATVAPRTATQNGGSVGGRLGTVVILPNGDRGTDLETRYGAFLRFRPAPGWEFGGEFHGSARLTGPAAGFEERSQHSMTLFLAPIRLKGTPELLLRVPLDGATKDYVDGVLSLRISF